MNVICYGDSNTYGYDPRSYFGGRYDPAQRWVDILGERTGWNVKNQGMNGREIPRNAICVPEGTDLLILMLGTNDLLQGSTPETAARRMEEFLASLSMDRNKILLIAPPPMQRGEWVPEDTMVNGSVQLAACYESLSRRLGISFLDAGQWKVEIAFDGVHFSEEGHRAFARGLCKALLGQD